jgi:tRNA dimethylallyltransferase
MSLENRRFIAVVGPTATGKTELGIRLAESFGGEVICADSRTIIRGMDIGTAKPTPAEQARVRHHLLDLIDPGERLSAAAFNALAVRAMDDISAREKIPVLVGGSGLYADAVLFDYQFPAEAEPEVRARYDVLSDEELIQLLLAEAPQVLEDIDISNRRRLIRALETAGQSRSRRRTMVPGAIVLGTMLNKETVQKRVQKRIELMLGQGFIEEVKKIGETYGWDSPAFDVIGYRAFRDYALGTKNLEAAVADFVRGDMQLYKKQVTWFKRNSGIKWVSGFEEARAVVSAILKV